MRLSEKALAFARVKHEGQVDKAGAPYINHPIAVAAQLEGEEEKAAAYLHDVMEDCGVSADELREEGFSDELINTLILLTHRKEVPYLDYVRALAHDSLARAVKMADLRHNMDMSRIPKPSERDFKRLERYKRAYALLMSTEE